jgi:hypothetical protein
MMTRRFARSAAAIAVAGVVLAGCGSDGDEDASDTDDSADVTVQVEIADGAVTPPPGRVSVELGDNLRIEITGDEPDEVHLHGYDLPVDIIPGEVAVLEFVADQAGRFELELHDAGLQLLQLEVE